MQRYHSIGVAGLVALMAAHREAGQAGGATAFDQDRIYRVRDYLYDGDPQAPTDGAATRKPVLAFIGRERCA